MAHASRLRVECASQLSLRLAGMRPGPVRRAAGRCESGRSCGNSGFAIRGPSSSVPALRFAICKAANLGECRVLLGHYGRGPKNSVALKQRSTIADSKCARRWASAASGAVPTCAVVCDAQDCPGVLPGAAGTADLQVTHNDVGISGPHPGSRVRAPDEAENGARWRSSSKSGMMD